MKKAASPIWLFFLLFFKANLVCGEGEGFDFFESKIRPVLIEHCYECHSSDADSIEGDYLLDTREGIRKGGASGRDAIIPGDVSGSQLIEAIRHQRDDLKMPRQKLSDSIIADFETWIAKGAPDPRDGVSKLPREIEAESHWFYHPITEVEIPDVKDREWPRDPVDRFVLDQLEKSLLAPNSDADRRTLIRRASLELIGLPPTPEEITSFLDDPSPTREAFSKVVDRLLEDPGFGERWGRHWLDVARFAESSGYSRNMLYPYAWRYRDWVIDAFNRDLPFDEFVRHQIAGDLIEAQNQEEREKQIMATAFLTIGPKTLNEGDPLLFDLNVADDQIDATCRAFLALTANCSRCHDHKYDPIPARDYYALAGIFRSSRNLAGVATNVRFEHEKAFPLGPEGEALIKRREEAIAAADAAQKVYINEVVKKRNEIRAALEKEGIDWRKNPSPELKKAEEKVQEHQDIVRAAKAAIPDPPEFAMAMAEAVVMAEEDWKKMFDENRKAKKPTDPRILNSFLYLRGDHKSPDKEVPRGMLSLYQNVLPFPEIGEGESGRLQLAQWLTDPKNPATARVFVNRVWHHLFGTGIVETVDNFGLLGAKPSHPELLDYLAAEFMDDGWSMKRLIRRLVLSRVWMLSSDQNVKNYAIDPGNRMLWRFSPQRLEGEVIRDSILFVGGNLDRDRPAVSQVEEIAKQQAKAQQREIGRRDYYNKDINTDVTHRSVYLPSARGAIFESMKLFDAPDPNLVAGARKVTTVPAQSLYLMNSPIVIENARKTAENLLASTIDQSERINRIFEKLFGRKPDSLEIEEVKAVLKGAENEVRAWELLIHSMMMTGEFRTVY